ncbi:MAG TPA: DNA-binding response regulator [Bacteroidales bacterium]|nr:MAG: hypothetical protein A2X11_16090 [Bacteroidetes bacterium GWE2_42_24]OFY29208.1 MAG: hypothetical protein A2X09_05745 [Bacteroidetes bacterium GWF2_43_11]HAQ65507.1 DNA-binding response regulator [Bacteroidales bacterium]HBZ66809.1 DNA-binding response regulator [Bacteroidales bacterium]
MLRIVIVDDEIQACNALKNMIGFYCREVDMVGMAHGVSEGVELIKQTNPDLVLLDIQMPDGLGFDVLKAFKEPRFRVVFVTAFEQYAIRAIRFAAFDYLLKPVNPDELADAITRAEANILSCQYEARIQLMNDGINPARLPMKRLVLNTSESVYVAVIDDIVRCEADQNYTHFFFGSRDRITVSRTLKEFDELLTEYGFFRVHQSHLINLAWVDRYDKGCGGMAVLKNKIKVPVSTRKKEMFIDALRKFL